MNTQRTKQLTTLAMMAALAFILTVVGRVPMVLFLKYDPKDIVLAVTGFIYGPFSVFIVSFLVSLVEMFTLSDTGIIGFFMNVLATVSFAGIAAYVYKKDRTLKGAVIGLTLGVVLMTAVMLLWNYIITPFYLGVPRSEVVKLLVPAILPFNLIKGSINAALTMIIYKPLVNILRKTNLIPPMDKDGEENRSRLGVFLISAMVIATSILVVLIIQGRI